MFRRRQNRIVRFKKLSRRDAKQREASLFTFERLELRQMFSSTPISLGAPMPPLTTGQSQVTAVSGSGMLMETSPFDFDQTFLLHSDPTATKRIYLDFTGHSTIGTAWNTAVNLPLLVSPEFDLDATIGFSDEELTTMQLIWERIAEDFRPFNVDVTTQDPGVEALRNTGGDDTEWGIRVVIGGSANDWYAPVTGQNNPGRAYLNSFSWDSDTPAFVWSMDFLAAQGATIDKFIGEATSHEVGHSLGLQHDGQTIFYIDATDPDDKKTVRHEVEYYAGHGTGQTGWAPIMGSSYVQELTQWNKGEYWNAINYPLAQDNQDDLATIISEANGFGYRVDDHGSSLEEASTLLNTVENSTTTFEDEGIIEQNTDVDYFTFSVGALGGILDLDIDPFHNGANLDVKATIRNASGTIIATSNPLDGIAAGTASFSVPEYTDGGWQLLADNSYVGTLTLSAGTYYVTIEGAGRPITFIDPAVHPGPPEIVQPDPPVDPLTLLPPDTSDWGYSNYGSLGYYKITGTLKQNLVVGVDFDVDGGTTPQNWLLYTGNNSGNSSLLTDLTSEAGDIVPYTLAISTTAQTINTYDSGNPIDVNDLPTHAFPLDKLDGYISADDTTTTTFVWGDLEAWSYHTIYIFGHADVDANNHILVTGGNLNGTIQTFTIDQTITPDGLVVNNGPLEGQQPTDDLSTFALKVLSDANGEIKIDVTSLAGFASAIAGLAIAPTRPIGPPQNGSITGQKWNDDDGNKLRDPGEEGLGGWTIYLDENNNGILDSITTGGVPGETVTLTSSQVPQAIPDNDNSGIKSALEFTGGGTIQDISVMVDISHTYVADLEITLLSPGGLRIPLASRLGIDGDNYTNTVFSDSAATSILNASPPFTGTFRPQVSLLNGDSGQNIAGLRDINAHGTWRIEVKDLGLDDTGSLNNWALTIATAAIPGTVQFTEPYQITDSSGNYRFGDLEPGLYNVREYIQPQQALAGWRQTWAPTPVTVTSGANLADHDFGNWIPDILSGSIQGQKFYDENQDGVKDPGETGMAGWIVYIDANGNGVRDVTSSAAVVPSENVPLNILDLKTKQSQITVGNLGSVFDIEVTLDITHSFVGDLDVYLSSPSGRQVKLFAGVGGQYNDFHNLTLSDDALRSITDIGFNDLPYTGTWRPEEPLSFLNGEDAAGIWTLSISDTFAGDQGTLNSWSLSFNSGEPYRITNADGNYKFDNVAAGTYAIREEEKPGWNQIAPAVTTIPGAVWSNSQWVATLNALNVFNVEKVNFAASPTVNLVGDFNRNGNVDAGDYIVWRRQSGSSVPNFTGADGNGDGMVDQLDFNLWRQNFGESLFDSGAGNGLANVSSGAAMQTVLADELMSSAVGLTVMPESTRHASLASPSNSTANVSAPSGLAASPLVVGQLYTVAGSTTLTSPERGAGACKQSFGFSSHNDLGLLAWLASSVGGSQAQDALATSTDKDFSTDFTNENSDSLDAAFELLEGNALVSTAI